MFIGAPPSARALGIQSLQRSVGAGADANGSRNRSAFAGPTFTVSTTSPSTDAIDARPGTSQRP